MSTPFHRFAIPLLLLGVFSGSAEAYNFSATDRDWQSWPPFCQAKYIDGGQGRRSKYAKLVRHDDVEKWKRALGKPTWSHLHHYCAGIAWMRRATDRGWAIWHPKETGGVAYRAAMDNLRYMYANMPESSKMFPRVGIDYAKALVAQGRDGNEVKEIYELLFSKFASDRKVYIGYAEYRADARDYDGAIEALLVGTTKVAPKKVGTLYSYLARYSIKAGYIEKAREYTDLAEQHGRKVSYLRSKIAKASGKSEAAPRFELAPGIEPATAE